MDRDALRHPLLPLGSIRLGLLVEQVLDKLDIQNARLELRITTDQAMTRLHARHLNGAGPTNVLAFPGEANNDLHQETTFLGSIALNADAVIREAALYQQIPMDHFIRLLTHAALHLAGFEHGQLMDDLTETVVQWCNDQGEGSI